MMNWLKIITTLTMLSFFSNANAQGYCDSSGAIEDDDGVITFTGPEGAIGDCAFAPDGYTIKIYKMALCTTAPSRPTTSDTYDVSSCVDVISSPDGQISTQLQGAKWSYPTLQGLLTVLILMVIY